MSVPASSGAFDHYRREVEAMLAYGCAIGTVEEVLERAPLDADQRSALWLYARGLGATEEEPDVVELVLVSG